jgi:hypothetical protein
MATYNKFQDAAEQILRGKHDFGSHVFKVALSNTAPNAATHTQLSDITQIAAGNGYVTGGFTLDTVVLSEAGGTAKVTIADEVILASGGAMAAFRYAVIYNDTSASDLLLGYYDYGSSVTLNDTEDLTIDFDAAAGVLTLA